MFAEILINAVATGILLGGIYAALALGLAVTFGILHIPNIAHPVFVVLGAYAAVAANERGWDPIVASLACALPFYALGALFYEFYARAFERRGEADTMQALTLFFGVSLVVETVLVLKFGTNPQTVDVDYVGQSLRLGLLVLPYRLLVPAAVAPVLILALWGYLKFTYAGIAIRAAAYDVRALQISGIDPRWIKRHAFGIASVTAAVAGAVIVIIGPVDPFSGRLQIGRAFAVVILAGMGAVPGTLVAAVIIGVAESLVSAFLNPSWAPGVAFTALLVTLALKPQGLFGSVR